MTTPAAFTGALAAFVLTALAIRLLTPFFRKKGLTRTALLQRDDALIPGATAIFPGGILLAAGFGAGALAGGAVSLLTGGELSLTAVNLSRLFGGIFFALLMALAGFLSDHRLLRGNEEHPFADLALQLVIIRFYTVLLSASGDRSKILVLPFFGQADIGWYYDVVCVLLILGACYGGRAQSEAGDISSTCAMFTGLSLASAGGILGSAPAAVIGASLAGCALGALLYSFPPAKILCGRSGGMLLYGAAAAAAMGCGVPVLLIPAALPLIPEGIFALARLCAFAFTGRELTAASFSGWLCEKGLDYRTVSLLQLGISLTGCAVTVFAALKM